MRCACLRLVLRTLSLVSALAIGQRSHNATSNGLPPAEYFAMVTDANGGKAADVTITS